MKKQLTLILAALLLSSSMTACGNGTAKETGAAETKTPETTVSETKTPETNAPATNNTANEKKSGCSSVVLGGVSVIIAVAGTAMLLKKKED